MGVVSVQLEVLKRLSDKLVESNSAQIQLSRMKHESRGYLFRVFSGAMSCGSSSSKVEFTYPRYTAATRFLCL
jgi:hypothetical protein